MRLDISPGTYVITPARTDSPVVGMTPLLRARQNNSDQPLAQGKPVELVPDKYPEYTKVWELTEDGTLALSFMGGRLYAREDDGQVYLGSDPYEWSVIIIDSQDGPSVIIESNTTGLAWFLPNNDVGTQPELRPLPDRSPPTPGFLFHFRPVNVY